MSDAAVAAERAGVETAKVSIQTVTVDGAKMTMATFRQLPTHEVVDTKGRIVGNPWGKVNYYFGECSGCTPDDHLHILGESGGSLWRSCFYRGRRPQHAVWMEAWAPRARWIGAVGEYLSKPDSVTQIEVQRGAGYRGGNVVVHFGDGGRFYTDRRAWSPTNSSYAAENAERVLWSSEEHPLWLTDSDIHNLQSHYDKRRERLLRDMREKIGSEYDGGRWFALADKMDEKAEEVDLRWAESLSVLLSLPQLYIAT